ncbi:hypothetical protein PIB30_060167, partial [Stylosanthes scabra]|nr:hypothetical protein [Stylosanthes scabra]
FKSSRRRPSAARFNDVVRRVVVVPDHLRRRRPSSPRLRCLTAVLSSVKIKRYLVHFTPSAARFNDLVRRVVAVPGHLRRRRPSSVA